MEPFVGYILESYNTEEVVHMEIFAIPALVVAMAIVIWILQEGPQNIFANRRRTAVANAQAAKANLRAEELRLERAKLEIG